MPLTPVSTCFRRPKTAGMPGCELMSARALAVAGVARQAAFLRWLSATLLGSIYPGAPFERKHMAMMLLNTLLFAWTSDSKDSAPARGAKRERDIAHAAAQRPKAIATSIGEINAFCPGFAGPPFTLALLGQCTLLIASVASRQHTPWRCRYVPCATWQAPSERAMEPLLPWFIVPTYLIRGGNNEESLP